MHHKDEWGDRARVAQAKAAHALERLLTLAETRDSGQIRHVAQFIAALYNGNVFPLDLFSLRAVDVEISDDTIACIDALRWGRADLYKLVPDGQQRIERVIKDWGVAPPEPPTPPDGADLAAKLVTYGDAPGYRSVTLIFDCQLLPRPSAEPAPLRVRLSVDAESAESIGRHIAEVQRYAWSPGRTPLDVRPGEQPPAWLGLSQRTTSSAVLNVAPAATRLAELVGRWNELGRAGESTDAGRALRARLRAVGEAAEAMGGFDAMTALDQAARRNGVDTSCLNELWDGIGDWMA